MQRILLRRILRDLKANAFRYLALFLLIILAMFMVIGVVASAESVIGTVDKKAAANHLEDGEFGVFLPLKEEETARLEAMGATLEECFYLDFQREDMSTLRLMQNREKINLIEIEDGAPAQNDREIVVERLYATAHRLAVGDTVTVAGQDFTVSGIGTTPDYDYCLRNMSDMAADGNLFGTAFVTKGAYEMLLSGGQALHAEEYRYGYRLGGDMTDRDLKDELLTMKIDPGDVQDRFFRETVRDKTKDRDALTEGMTELANGSDAISTALHKLDAGTAELEDGIQAVHNGLEQLNGQSAALTGGSAKMLAALRQLEENAGKLSLSTASIRDLRDASSQMLTAMQELEAGLRTLSGQVSYDNFAALLRTKLPQDPAQLSPDAQLLLGVVRSYLTEVNAQLTTAADGAASLRAGFASFDSAMAALPDALTELNGGIRQFQQALDTLATEYEHLDSGVSAYSRGLAQLYKGAKQLTTGAKSLNAGASQLAENGDSFRAGVEELQTGTGKLLDTYFPFATENLTDFVTAADNPRIKAANDDVIINIRVGLLAGIIILVMLTYVISVFTVHSIDRESAMIGALYALGLRRKQLMLHYSMLPVLLCLLGGIAGTLLGYSPWGLTSMAGVSYTYYSIPAIETVYSPYLLLYGLALPPLIAFAVTQMVIRKRLSRSVLSLLRKEQPQGKKGHIRLLRLSFIRTFQIRQLLREKRSGFAVLAGMFVSLLILITGLNCYVLSLHIQEQNAADTKYAYMYQYKYPTRTAPEGGYPAYAEELKKEAHGYDMAVSVIGLTADNPFFPAIASERKNEISISSSVASKFGLSVGDTLMLSDETSEAEYGFTVKEIVPYSVGLSCFMDIDSMRTLFGRESDYYNIVYAGQALDIDTGRLYGVTTKADIVKSGDIFMEIMMSLIITLNVTAALVFLIVLYQMMKVMTDRAAPGIAMMKIFGYRSREIRKLYLDGNFLLIAIGALAALPLAKAIMDAVYPAFVANVACGLDLTWPLPLYALVYGGILLSYLLIRMLLMDRLKKVSLAEVLKDRE